MVDGSQPQIALTERNVRSLPDERHRDTGRRLGGPLGRFCSRGSSGCHRSQSAAAPGQIDEIRARVAVEKRARIVKVEEIRKERSAHERVRTETKMTRPPAIQPSGENRQAEGVYHAIPVELRLYSWLVVPRLAAGPRRKSISREPTASGCSCCAQCPAPSSRWHPTIRVQAISCICSKAPGR